VNEILSTLLAILPPKRKSTPSGWISFDAVCCHHRGEKPDTRKRGGLLSNNQDSFQYNCFNCGFKAGYSLGKPLTNNTKLLLTWLGLTKDQLGRLQLIALQLRDQLPKTEKILDFDIKERALPDTCMPLTEWMQQDLPQDLEEDLIKIVAYLDSRGMDIDWYPWHWSISPGYRDRLLIPYYQDGKIVGSTARKITEGKPKYISDAQPGYVFNLDRQSQDRQFVIIVEGQFDAIGIDGCAVMHNSVTDVQAARINALNREVILVPDRDRAGAKLINDALKYSWTVSSPPWGEAVKDPADAVKLYGRLYTLTTILHYKESNQIKQQLLKKRLEHGH